MIESKEVRLDRARLMYKISAEKGMTVVLPTIAKLIESIEREQ